MLEMVHGLIQLGNLSFKGAILLLQPANVLLQPHLIHLHQLDDLVLIALLR